MAKKTKENKENTNSKNQSSKAQKTPSHGKSRQESIALMKSQKAAKKNAASKRKAAEQSAVKSEESLKQSSAKSGGKGSSRRSSKPRNGSQKKYSKKSSSPIKIAFLGGINEVGKNMTLYEYEDDMFIVDCGLSFPDADMPGIDMVIPDFSYVEKNSDKIKGIVITHGHEDHIGGLAYLLKSVNIPVYGTKLTIGLIEGKLKEHGLLSAASLNVVQPGDVIQLGKFSVEMIHVNHSIPDAIALAVKTDAGTIVQTGDFKIDTTPIDGDVIDLARFAQLGSEGVLAMLSDSTNAERPGFTESERKVGESLDMLFRQAKKNRIIIATFASNIHRVQQIINVASSVGRKVCMVGRSLENVVSISSELGYLDIPDNLLIQPDEIGQYKPEKLVIITTGSQGEPMSALTRMAFSDHRKVEIMPNDFVIISATPIPGNEKTVGNVVNELMKLGAHVIYEKMYDVHVSGHACREELKLLMSIVKPKYFIPVHGEQKHLQKHAELALSIGIPKSNIFIADNGVVAEITEKSIKKGAPVTAGKVFVDGSGVGDVGSAVIRDRKRLGEDGIIVVTASLDYETGQLIAGPEVLSKGFVYVKEAEELLDGARFAAEKALENCYYSNINDVNAIKGKVKDAVSKYVREKTRRDPVILPVIMEV